MDDDPKPASAQVGGREESLSSEIHRLRSEAIEVVDCALRESPAWVERFRVSAHATAVAPSSTTRPSTGTVADASASASTGAGSHSQGPGSRSLPGKKRGGRRRAAVPRAGSKTPVVVQNSHGRMRMNTVPAAAVQAPATGQPALAGVGAGAGQRVAGALLGASMLAVGWIPVLSMALEAAGRPFTEPLVAAFGVAVAAVLQLLLVWPAWLAARLDPQTRPVGPWAWLGAAVFCQVACVVMLPMLAVHVRKHTPETRRTALSHPVVYLVAVVCGLLAFVVVESGEAFGPVLGTAVARGQAFASLWAASFSLMGLWSWGTADEAR